LTKGGTTADGLFTLSEVECLGACANAPMVAIHDYYYEALTPQSLGGLLDKLDAGEIPPPGSAIGRQGCAPEGGALTLNDAALYDGSRAEKRALPNLPAKEPA